jgi:hypothetical protein
MMRRIFVLFCAVGLVFMNCKLVSEDGGNGGSVSSLKINQGEITGWNESSSDGFTEFDASGDLEKILDGGSPLYTQNGLLNGFKQVMVNGDMQMAVIVNDFGTKENAAKMIGVLDAAGQIDTKESVQGFSASTAVFDVSPLSGITAFACFGPYFLRLDLTGISDKNEAKNIAIDFLEYFQSKEGKLN